MKTSQTLTMVAVLVLLTLGSLIAFGQNTPSDDAYTNTAAPTTNYGTATTLGVVSATETTFFRFDLSSIPTGYTSANVAKASLKLYVNAVTTAGSFNVDFVNGTWSEKTITASLSPALGTTIAASVPLAKTNTHDYILVDVTSAVGEWLNGTQANDGLALVPNSPLNASFDSKENTTQSHPPELDIVFTGSGGGTITGVLTGLGSGLTGGGSSGTLNVGLLTSCASNQILQWTGNSWACSNAGTGTITGLTAGTDLTGGGTSGSVTLNLDTTKVPQLNVANAFTGNQTVNGNLSATGVVTGSSFQIGSNLFAFGSYANNNAFLGFAGNSTMTGNDNTASGVSALSANTTGNGNTANGGLALARNTTGANNTASGDGALFSNATGSFNTADGMNALSNTTGSGNAASGQAALFWNSSGNNNTAIGFSSGNPTNGVATTGSNNTYVGYQTNPGTNTNLSNATAIGANAQVTASNAMVLGSISGVNGATASTNVGIGTTAPAATLDVHGTGNFTGLITFAPGQAFAGTGTITGVSAGTDLTGGGASGNVTLNVDTTKVVTGIVAGTDLTGGGTGGTPTLNLDTTKVPQLNATNTFTGNQTVNGNLSATGVVTGSGFQIGSNLFAFGSYASFNTFLGLFAGNSTMTGTGNTASGDGALNSNATGINNTASGWNALTSNTTSNYNTASGAYALWSNTTSGYNTASGAYALYANTGTLNTASGAYALYANTTGGGNSASGAYALYVNTTGGSNTATGWNALSSNTTSNYNTASGAYALYANTTGSDNTASGAGALRFNTTGGSNSASGAYALYANTGTGNTASGAYALYANTTGGGNTASGLEALYLNTTGSNNTASGTQALFLNTTGSSNTASGWNALFSNTTGSNNTALGISADVGFGNLSNATAIGAYAQVTFSNSMVLGSISGVNGALADTFVGIGSTAPGNIFTIGQGKGHAIADGWDTYSSRRWKTNIDTLHGALAKVEQLRGVSYDMKESGKHEVGVIAEEVGAVVPEIVSWEKNGKNAQGVDYGRLTALLIEATKEQQKLIDKQQVEIARLTRQVKTIQATLKANGRKGSEVRTVKAERTTLHQ